MNIVDSTNSSQFSARTPETNVHIIQENKTVEETSIKSKPPSQFKRAFNFFKNLEKSPFQKKKSPLKPKPELKRRFSLDFTEKKNKRERLGGSLRLPKTVEKFAISRIYFDIMETKTGKFKGVPNRVGLSESLASLNAKTEKIMDESDDPISYNMFWNKGKPKKRRSLKSVFNIHY